MADVGAHERELAMEALDAHRRAGRLERAEHASRCRSASTATSRSQLDALFADLPDPHPAFPGPPPGRDPAPSAGSGAGDAPVAPELPELVTPSGAAIARHAGLISLLTPAAAAVLFALSGGRFPWIFILVPIVLAAVAWISHREGQ